MRRRVTFTALLSCLALFSLAHLPRAGAQQAGDPIKPEHRSFWSFQPIGDPPVPSVRGAAGNSIDAFLLVRLEAAGLTFRAEADRRTLLRRATYDLTGLPPTPEETAAFLADRSPNAFEKVVDRLLASPHYGERQARRWLDLARYADSNGLDENLAMANAWRYRDWVVAALNAAALSAGAAALLIM